MKSRRSTLSSLAGLLLAPALLPQATAADQKSSAKAGAATAVTGMVLVPAGEFLRGRSHPLPDDGLKWVPTVVKDDRPVQRIYVDAYWLDQHEVTNRQYQAFVKATRHRPPYNWSAAVMPAAMADLPVVDVDWHDATAYAQWTGKRLPTEAEWERAARGELEGKTYPWGDEAPVKQDTEKDGQKLISRAVFDGLNGPAKVCSRAATGFGLCDMAGNVWEWTADWYERTYYEKAPARNPTGPSEVAEATRYRVLRGGSWADEAKYLTCAHRSWARPAERSPNIGFRCARSVTAAERSR